MASSAAVTCARLAPPRTRGYEATQDLHAPLDRRGPIAARDVTSEAVAIVGKDGFGQVSAGDDAGGGLRRVHGFTVVNPARTPGTHAHHPRTNASPCSARSHAFDALTRDVANSPSRRTIADRADSGSVSLHEKRADDDAM